MAADFLPLNFFQFVIQKSSYGCLLTLGVCLGL